MREAVAGAATDRVDDAALASIEHRRRSHPTGMKGSTQIHLDILPPDIGVAFPNWTEGPEGAVIVDHQVNRAKFARDAGESILYSDRHATRNTNPYGKYRFNVEGNLIRASLAKTAQFQTNVVFFPVAIASLNFLQSEDVDLSRFSKAGEKLLHEISQALTSGLDVLSSGGDCPTFQSE
jgi:hypothetical protein